MRVIDGNTLEKEMQKFEYRNGIYEGEAINNVPNGNGKVTWKDDFYYEGGFLNGSFQEMLMTILYRKMKSILYLEHVKRRKNQLS